MNTETAEKFGTFLKTYREKKGIRLEEIASITKIHLHSLQLLERSQWKQLPPEPFIRGFIIAYAKYVGLEPKDVLQKYCQEKGLSGLPEIPKTASPDEKEPSAKTADDIIEANKPLDRRKILIFASMSIASVLTIAVIYIGKKTSDPQPIVVNEKPVTNAVAENFAPVDGKEVKEIKEFTPSVTSTKEQREVASGAKAVSLNKSTAPEISVANSTSEKVAEPTAPHVVTVEGNERTWLKVVIDDTSPRDFFLQAGKKVVYTAQSKIKVVLGNSTGTKVVHNGENAAGVKFSGTIRSYIFPADARFPQDVPKRTLSKDEDEKPSEAVVGKDEEKKKEDDD